MLDVWQGPENASGLLKLLYDSSKRDNKLIIVFTPN